jgi:hypothetical protein
LVADVGAVFAVVAGDGFALLVVAGALLVEDGGFAVAGVAFAV